MQRWFRAVQTEQYLTDMNKSHLTEIKLKLMSLSVFRQLLEDGIICAFLEFLSAKTAQEQISTYSAFVSLLYSENSGSFTRHIKYICLNSENVFVKLIGKNKEVAEYISQSVENELSVLQEICDITCEELISCIDWNGTLPHFDSHKTDLRAHFYHRAENIGKYGYGMYAKNPMFYIDENNRIIPVKNPDTIRLSAFKDYESQRSKVLENTKALLNKKPASNILLTGDAGTGKSSTVKAVANELFSEGLRLIEVRKDQLSLIPKILDELSENPLKFVLFIDDLSFLKDDDNFNALKAVLEGSVSAKSENVVIYATSNRRHIIKETFSDRQGDEVHLNDTMQELVSLSERFGMHISFSKPNKETYLNIVKHIASENSLSISEDELELKAERFALQRGGRSARIAKQFVDILLSEQH